MKILRMVWATGSKGSGAQTGEFIFFLIHFLGFKHTASLSFLLLKQILKNTEEIVKYNNNKKIIRAICPGPASRDFLSVLTRQDGDQPRAADQASKSKKMPNIKK